MVRDTLVSVSVMTTGALGTTAPVVSVTVPVMVPLPVDWALDGMAGHSSRAAADARARSRFADRVRFIGIWNSLCGSSECALAVEENYIK
jgi:hypothetical protein